MMMIKYKVYYQDGVLLFADDLPENYTGESLRLTDTEIISTKVLQKVQITKRLLLISSDVEGLFLQFCTQLPLIEAGGGLVRNDRSELLMIFRNGRWDLPKGKLEPGETMEECALREVEEETGVDGLVCDEFRGYTFHCYMLHDQMVLKRTTWYDMHCTENSALTPQTEEGIARAEWIMQGELSKFLALSYPTICDLFTE